MVKHIITSGGQEIGLSRCVRLNSSQAEHGGTAPDATTLVNTRGLAFDANVELVFLNFKIPTDWDGISNIMLKICWYPESGDALLLNETCKFDISYNSVALTETVDNGAEKAETVTYTEAGNPGTDKLHIHSNITLAYDDGDQPLTADNDLFIKFNRDFNGDTYAGDAVVLYWELCYTSNAIPTLS